jgi:hypothetical protein
MKKKSILALAGLSLVLIIGGILLYVSLKNKKKKTANQVIKPINQNETKTLGGNKNIPSIKIGDKLIYEGEERLRLLGINFLPTDISVNGKGLWVNPGDFIGDCIARVDSGIIKTQDKKDTLGGEYIVIENGKKNYFIAKPYEISVNNNYKG